MRKVIGLLIMLVLICGCANFMQSAVSLKDTKHQGFEDDFYIWHTEFRFKHFKEGGCQGGFVRCSEPTFILDDAHEPNLGLIHIVFGANTVEPFPDLRGAKVSVCLRGVDFKTNGAKFVFLVQSQEKNGFGVKANWAYTGLPLTKYLLDGKWHRVNFTIVNDESKWTYAGNNPKRPTELSTYQYLSLDTVLANNNLNFAFILINVDKDNPPVGSIDFDEFRLEHK